MDTGERYEHDKAFLKGKTEFARIADGEQREKFVSVRDDIATFVGNLKACHDRLVYLDRYHFRTVGIGQPRYNRYDCEKCHQPTWTFDLDRGVTPFMHRCVHCDGLGTSNMYRVHQLYEEGREIHELWYRPSAEDASKMDLNQLLHVLEGGLITCRIHDCPTYVVGAFESLKRTSRFLVNCRQSAHARDQSPDFDRERFVNAMTRPLTESERAMAEAVDADDPYAKEHLVMPARKCGKTEALAEQRMNTEIADAMRAAFEGSIGAFMNLPVSAVVLLCPFTTLGDKSSPMMDATVYL